MSFIQYIVFPQDIRLLSSKIGEDAARLLNPADNFDGVTVMNSVDDIMDIDMFGQVRRHANS